MLRADNSTSASDPDAPGDIKFVARGAGFHATNPRAAVFWNPANTITGDYSLKGTFTLLEPSNHTNYCGLVFGGSQLDGPAQQAEVIMRDAVSDKSAPVTEAMTTLGQQCQSCHAMYREQFANGAFRIKNS